jgi:rare lipoprotein A
MKLVFLTLIATMLFGACASTKRITESGVASWYGPDFHGKRTASGETYDQRELTAAHKTLPFNTVVRVTNLDNGKQVVVRINDRGPYSRGRVIDLSRAAAEEVSMIRAGTANVKIEVLHTDRPIIGELSREIFGVQIASLADPDAARAKANEVRGGWVLPARVDGQRVYRVMVGRYGTKEQAHDAMQELKRQGIDGFVKQVQN